MTEILATEATISTLKVEIKALTVSGKQMTLAVFKQLPQMPLAWDSNTGAFWMQGRALWGRVLYGIKDQGEHWIVLEENGCLYRMPFPAANAGGYGKWEEWQRIRRGTVEEVKRLPVRLEEAKAELHNYEKLGQGNVNSVWFAKRAADSRENVENLTSLLRDRHQALVAHMGLEGTVLKQKDAWESSLKMLGALPQLFIAV